MTVLLLPRASLNVSNGYAQPTSRSHYSWMKDMMVVEPYKETTLTAVSSLSDAELQLDRSRLISTFYW